MFRRFLILTWAAVFLACSPVPEPSLDAGPPTVDAGHHYGAFNEPLGGDLSGTAGAATVVRINNTTVPVGGALTTGAVLRATGPSNASYGAVNLASGSAVTGTLATGNQASQNMGGDISGTTAAATVAVSSGLRSLTTTVTTTGSVAPTNGQVLTATSGTNATWQTAAGGGTPGGANTQVQYNNVGAFAGSANLTFDGTNVTAANKLIAPGLDTSGASQLVLGAANATSVRTPNFFYAGGAGGADMPTAGALRVPASNGLVGRYNNTTDYWMISLDAVANLYLGSAYNSFAVQTSNIYLSAHTGVSTLVNAATETVQTAGQFQLYADANYTVAHRDVANNSATGKSLSIHAQNNTGITSTGGDLKLGGGTGTSANGSVDFQNQTVGTGGTSIGGGTLLTGLTAKTLPIKVNGTVYYIVLLQ